MKNNLLNLKAMKQILSVFTIAAFMVACNQTPQTSGEVKSATTVVLPDTTGLAEYQAWKVENELQRQDDLVEQNNQAVQTRTTATTKPRATTRNTSTARNRSTSTANRGSTGNTGTQSTSTASNQKKGWSKAAKGAVIGGVAGGTAGAVINKRNRVVGGVVGAVIGAGGGYVIGRSKDKKDGRN